jgi:hypothetical protein
MGVSDSGIGGILAPTKDMLSGSIGGVLGKYGWVLFVFVIIAIAIGGVWLWKTVRKKDDQWTHKLKVRRVINNDTKKLSDEVVIIRMRRFPLIKNANVFELEKPLLGSYLCPELDRYSGHNEYSLVIDTNNRVYTDLGSFFNPDSHYVNVSARHSEIDIQLSDLKADYQNVNKISKRVEWATIAKYAFIAIGIVAIMVVSIVAIQNWGESQKYKAESDQAQAQAMENLAKAMVTIEATVNTQKLIIPELKELKGTNNLQGIINGYGDNNGTS